MTSFNRVFVASIPPHSGEPLLFRSLTGEESLSALYEFNVTLLCASHSVDLNSLLGKSLTLEIDDIPATPRYLNGVITSMSLSGRSYR
jgi:type VI secretion system secreted protein VgrG